MIVAPVKSVANEIAQTSDVGNPTINF